MFNAHPFPGAKPALDRYGDSTFIEIAQQTNALIGRIVERLKSQILSPKSTAFDVQEAISTLAKIDNDAPVAIREDIVQVLI